MEMSALEGFLLVAIVICLAVVGFLFLKVKKIQGNYTRLTKNVSEGNLEELLKQHLERIKIQENALADVKKEIERLQLDAAKHVQRMGFKRFNPFEQTGGDQSFALVLLDKMDNGVIISSLHQREVTRVYAKLVNKGKSEYKLSAEEQEVLDNTLAKHHD